MSAPKFAVAIIPVCLVAVVLTSVLVAEMPLGDSPYASVVRATCVFVVVPVVATVVGRWVARRSTR
jgi:ACR3 family arsenite efflux pump ArsB